MRGTADGRKRRRGERATPFWQAIGRQWPQNGLRGDCGRWRRGVCPHRPGSWAHPEITCAPIWGTRMDNWIENKRDLPLECMRARARLRGARGDAGRCPDPPWAPPLDPARGPVPWTPSWLAPSCCNDVYPSFVYAKRSGPAQGGPLPGWCGNRPTDLEPHGDSRPTNHELRASLRSVRAVSPLPPRLARPRPRLLPAV